VSDEGRRFAPLDAIEALLRRRVRFVVIGGFGAQLLGSSLITGDLDVCYARDRENLARMAEALRELHARLRGAPEDVPSILDSRTLEMGDHFTFLTDAGPFDILGHPSGVPGGFEELEPAATEIDLDGYTVKVASIDDLIKMKRAAGRPKDLFAVEELGALRDAIDARAQDERRKRRRDR
jgi:hypothetical protein